MKLYEIQVALDEALSNLSVDEDTGEVCGMEAVETLQLEKKEKTLGIGKFIKSLEAECKAIKEELTCLNNRLYSRTRKIERLNKLIADYMPIGEKYEDSQCALSWRRSEAVEILDIKKLDYPYYREEVIVTPDKKAIKEAIKKGNVVEGATILQRWNLQII